jgi:hypothetical protein
MAMYKLTSDPTTVQRLPDGAFIPFDIRNPDYREYLTWLEKGNTPEPLPVVVPSSVTMRQARLALLAAGLLDDVDTAIAAIPDAAQRQAATVEWEYAATVDRGSAWTQTLAASLGLDADALDALFTNAATL